MGGRGPVRCMSTRREDKHKVESRPDKVSLVPASLRIKQIMTPAIKKRRTLNPELFCLLGRRGVGVDMHDELDFVGLANGPSIGRAGEAWGRRDGDVDGTFKAIGPCRPPIVQRDLEDLFGLGLDIPAIPEARVLLQLDHCIENYLKD